METKLQLQNGKKNDISNFSDKKRETMSTKLWTRNYIFLDKTMKHNLFVAIGKK